MNPSSSDTIYIMQILNYKKYHFIGIGGIGVSAIARMMHLQSKEVNGSDSNESEITRDLQNLGIKIYIGQRAENLEEDTEVVIYSIAIKEDNPEILEAKKRDLLCLSYPQFLGELSQKMFTIAVSGTHGKTTTTAMLGHILKKAGFDPTVVVGSKILGENSNFIAGKSKYLIVEACEYRRSFLNLSPTILVITNIEADHLDYYKDLNDIKSAFDELKSKTLQNGGQVITEMEYKNVERNFNMPVSGEHNYLDAQAAIKAAEAIGVSQEKSKEFLKDFRGTWRRLEYKGEKGGAVFYDDYAHHPTEIKASLFALRAKHPNRKLICVFEPHQQSRTKAFFGEFVEALKNADRIFIAPIFITREKDDHKTTNEVLAGAISKFRSADPVKNSSELKDFLAREISTSPQPLCIVLMGAGDIYKWTRTLVHKCAGGCPKF